MTFGGTDPAGLTTRCAQLFAHNLPPDVEIVAVLGLGVDSADLPSRVIVKRQRSQHGCGDDAGGLAGHVGGTNCVRGGGCWDASGRLGAKRTGGHSRAPRL